MNLCVEIRKNTYYDSVALMLINKEIKKMSQVKDVIVGMGTDLNKELAVNLSLSNDLINALTPNDFFVSATSEENNILEMVIEKLDKLLNTQTDSDDSSFQYKKTTINSAVKSLKGANMAVISLPGQYAAYEAKKALNNNLHVMLFSDNVTIKEELELKKIGRDKGLLVMGPDCGTAIINGVPLCFANAVRRGDIGVVGASGTGTQEITVIIDKMGFGLSQVIGTGGRDLKSEIGGIMMIEGFKALIKDKETKVIVLVSKPPAPDVAEKVLNMVRTTDKPVVVCFIGGDRCVIEKYGAYSCLDLEDAARKAVLLSQGKKVEDFNGFTLESGEIEKIVEEECKKISSCQKYLRALYTGGTLADEAMKILLKEGYGVYSNIPLSPELRLKDIYSSFHNTCIDLGDDDFTIGKPHPMIDPASRVERIRREALDLETAIVLMDFVLGYGSNIDPAGEMIESIREAKISMSKQNKYLCVIGYVCGTNKDPQDYKKQCEKLKQEGVILMESNAQAVKLCSLILGRLNKV